MTRAALVLTAGLGTRLRPLTDVRAKPAMPVGGQPMIHRIIRALVAQGVDDLVLNLHHLPATLTSIVGDGSDLGARVRYSWEPAILGPLRDRLEGEGGSVAVEQCPAALKERIDVWGPVDPPALALMRRIKTEFDPTGVLNPGRFVSRL